MADEAPTTPATAPASGLPVFGDTPPPPAPAEPPAHKMSSYERLQRATKAMGAADLAPAPEPAPPAEAAPAAPNPATPAPAAEEPPPASPADRGWAALNKAERKLAEEREAFKKEREALVQSSTGVERLKSLEQAIMAGNPLPALRAFGYDDDRLAGLILEGSPAPAQHTSQEVTKPAPAAQPENQSDLEKKIAELERTINMLGGHLGYSMYERAAFEDPKLTVMARLPGGIDAAVQRAQKHFESTGEQLTPKDALAMARDEFIAAKKQELQQYAAFPELATELGLSTSPVSPTPAPAPTASTAPVDAHDVTISNNFAASPPKPPVNVAKLSDRERLKRAVEAMGS